MLQGTAAHATSQSQCKVNDTIWLFTDKCQCSLSAWQPFIVWYTDTCCVFIAQVQLVTSRMSLWMGNSSAPRKRKELTAPFTVKRVIVLPRMPCTATSAASMVCGSHPTLLTDLTAQVSTAHFCVLWNVFVSSRLIELNLNESALFS